MSKEMTVAAGEFKARCLQLMDEVNEQGMEITITKHGRPVARLVPTERKLRAPKELYGAMAGMAVITGDIVSPLDVVWDACE